MNITIKPEKLWDLLLKAEILECESVLELRYVDHLYPVDLSDEDSSYAVAPLAKPGSECARIIISYPDTSDDSWDLSKEEVLGCKAIWDTECEEITITELNGEKCYLPSFRVYRSIKPEL